MPHAIGADALQVFVDNPTAWKRRAEPPAELPAFRERLAALGIGPIAVHASYLVNLAGPDDDLFERSVALLAHELAVAPDYGARFVNVHVGSHKGAGVAAGVARVADGVARVLAGFAGGRETPGGSPDVPLLVLENSAGGGDGIGATLEELEAILEAVAARGVPADRLGLCLDTAHLWGAGHDVATAEGVDALVEALAAGIGLERLVMIHLNDSKATRGSRLDRHEHLGAGEMGDGRRPRPPPDPPGPGPRRLLPRDAGDGPGLRRGQRGARAQPGRGAAAGPASAGGLRAARGPLPDAGA